MSSVWINGNLVDEDSATVSLRDTGLLHAAGVFTTMRAYNGKVFRLDHHINRLRESCEDLFVPLHNKDQELRQAVTDLLAANGLKDARLRLTVTRGATSNDPLHGLVMHPNVFLTATEVTAYPAEFYLKGMTVIVLDQQKLNPYDIQAGHKTLNYFSRFAGLKEANRRGAGEALWFNVHNYLQSGSVSNVFVVKSGKLLTPPTPEETKDQAVASRMPYPKSAVLPGVTRATVLEIARKTGLEVELCAIDINMLLEAEECFLTNSIMQVMPICRIERKSIGSDKPGELTQQIMRKYDEAIREATV